MELLNTREELRRWVEQHRREGLITGFVPTMGALHEGHLSLVRQAARTCDRVIASIFVNPTQFGPGEDFDRYPRQEAQDRALLEQAGCHALFLPGVADIYPPGQQTMVRVEPLGSELCGAFRPGHFQGVATVVAILFNLVQPRFAFFGNKDYQQVAVIRRMAADLAMPVEIVGLPTVRDADGLALSSRNAYLSPPERAQALALSHALKAAAAAVRNGERDGKAVESLARQVLTDHGVERIDYVAVRRAGTLEAVERFSEAPVLLLAAHVGKTRLIDNMILSLGK